MVRSGVPAGVLALFGSGAKDVHSEHDRALATAVAQQVALALENAFYFQQAHSRAMNLETVFRISQAVSSSLQIKVVLNRVLDIVQKILSADAVVLMTYDEAKDVAALKGVLRVIPDELQQLTTDSSPRFLGLTGGGEAWKSGVTGEGVVVGVIRDGLPLH